MMKMRKLWWQMNRRRESSRRRRAGRRMRSGTVCMNSCFFASIAFVSFVLCVVHHDEVCLMQVCSSSEMMLLSGTLSFIYPRTSLQSSFSLWICLFVVL